MTTDVSSTSMRELSSTQHSFILESAIELYSLASYPESDYAVQLKLNSKLHDYWPNSDKPTVAIDVGKFINYYVKQYASFREKYDKRRSDYFNGRAKTTRNQQEQVDEKLAVLELECRPKHDSGILWGLKKKFNEAYSSFIMRYESQRKQSQRTMSAVDLATESDQQQIDNQLLTRSSTEAAQTSSPLTNITDSINNSSNIASNQASNNVDSLPAASMKLNKGATAVVAQQASKFRQKLAKSAEKKRQREEKQEKEFSTLVATVTKNQELKAQVLKEKLKYYQNMNKKLKQQ